MYTVIMHSYVIPTILGYAVCTELCWPHYSYELHVHIHFNINLILKLDPMICSRERILGSDFNPTDFNIYKQSGSGKCCRALFSFIKMKTDVWRLAALNKVNGSSGLADIVHRKFDRFITEKVARIDTLFMVHVGFLTQTVTPSLQVIKRITSIS